MENSLKAGARRWAPAFFFVLCACWYYHHTIAIQVPGLIDTNSDFRPYQQAARAILHGQSPYQADGYIYPPLLAFLLTPLAPIDYVTARRLWFAIGHLFLIVAAILLWRRSGRDWIAACAIAFVWAAGGSAEEALGLGQVGPLLTLLVAIAMTADREPRGVAVATGFAIKLFPGLASVPLLMRRERRAIVAMLLTASGAILLPWAAVASFLRGPVKGPAVDAWTGTPATLSWSLPSVALRILDPPGQAYPLPSGWESGTDLERFRLSTGAKCVSLFTASVTLLAGLWFLWRKTGAHLSDEQAPWAIAALISLALAATPVGWTHYQVLQYPGIALLLIQCWRDRGWTRLAVALTLASLLYVIPVAVLTSYYLRYHAWTAHSPATLYLWTSVTPVASLGLFAMLVRQTARRNGSSN